MFNSSQNKSVTHRMHLRSMVIVDYIRLHLAMTPIVLLRVAPEHIMGASTALFTHSGAQF